MKMTGTQDKKKFKILLRSGFCALKRVPSQWLLLIFISPAACLPAFDLKEDLHILPGPQDMLSSDGLNSTNFVNYKIKHQKENLTEEDVDSNVSVVIKAYMTPPSIINDSSFETSPYTNNASILAKNVPEVVSTDPVVSEFHNEGVWLGLQWWQILLVFLASLLLLFICLYFTGCCFLMADCCSDPFWCCCPSCSACVGPLKPPKPKRKSKKILTVADISSPSSLRDSSLYKRKRDKKTAEINPVRKFGPVKQEEPNKMLLASQELNESLDLSSNNSLSHLNHTVATEYYTEENYNINNLYSSDIGTDKSVESNPNIKQFQPTTIETDHGDDNFFEQQPEVQEGKNKLNLSSLNVFGRNRRKQYTITTAEKTTKRHSKYHFIADFQSTVVVATKITKKFSTASNYLVKPGVEKRRNSLSSAGSLQDLPSASDSYSPLA